MAILRIEEDMRDSVGSEVGGGVPDRQWVIFGRSDLVEKAGILGNGSRSVNKRGPPES